MKTIITTVGTSIFTNLTKDNKNPEIKQRFNLLNEPKQHSFSMWDEFKKRVIDDRGRRQGLRTLVENAIQDDHKASAEIESILKIAKDEEVNIHLLATDTILSVLAAEIVAKWFEGKQNVTFNASYKQDVIEGLRVVKAKEFRKNGLPNLLNRLDELIVDENSSPYITLNVTGGYKAIIPFATTYAQINEIQICYLFEDEDEIINFPPFPIDIDYSFIGKYNQVFEKLSEIQEGSWQSFSQENSLPNYFSNYVDILDFDNEEAFELNPIGKYIFKRFRDYFVVEVEQACGIFSENAGNKNELLKTLKELFEKLMNEITFNNIKSEELLLKYIYDLGSKNDLRHGSPNPSNNMFIFKSTNKGQIRIVYTPLFKNGYLSLKVYDYKRGQFDHKSYINELNKKFKLETQFDFINITLKK